MDVPGRLSSGVSSVVGLLALVAFLASILAVVRGNFAYPVELFLIALLGLLLAASLASSSGGAVSALLFAIFFIAAIANMAYLYSVANYLSPVRTGTIAVAVVGLLFSATHLLAQPVPAALKSEVRKLLAAEKKLGEARQKLESVKAAMPAGAVRARGAARRAGRPMRRKK